MEQLPYDIELFDKYLSGIITKEELTTLQGQFDSPEALAREVQLHQAIEQGIQSAGNQGVIDNLVSEIEMELQADGYFEKVEEAETKEQAGISNMLSGIEEDLVNEGYYKKIANRRRIVLWSKRIASVAALFLLFPIGFAIKDSIENYYINQYISGAQQIEQPYIATKINALQAKIDEGKVGYAGGVTIPQLKSLKAALSAYQAENYSESTKQLDEFLRLHPQNEIANFYRGLCVLQAKKYTEAEELFAKDIYDQFKDSATYFRALCLLKLGQIEKALPLLQQVTQGNSSHSTTAQELLKKY